MLKLDDFEDIISAGVILLTALGMILLFALRRQIKVGKGGAIIGGKQKGDSASCAPYFVAHDEMLKALTENMAALGPALRGINSMQLAQTQALDVLLGIAEGSSINGQVARARSALTRAEGYKEATDEMGDTQ